MDKTETPTHKIQYEDKKAKKAYTQKKVNKTMHNHHNTQN
jgi:hypothetical protein